MFSVAVCTYRYLYRYLTDVTLNFVYVDRSPCILRLRYYFIDPVFELWDPHVHSRAIWFATSHAPRYDTGHYPAIVGSLYNHGPTRVTLYKSTRYLIYCLLQQDRCREENKLHGIIGTYAGTYFARIVTTIFRTRTDKCVRYLLYISSLTEHIFANGIVEHWNCCSL